MPTFESGFEAVESALDELDARVRNLQGHMRRFRAAAKAGDLRQMRDSQSKLGADGHAVGSAIETVCGAWPFIDADESAYLRDEYPAELVRVGAQHGVDIFERDSRLLAFPALLKIDAAARKVRVNKKQVASLRPSALVGLLKALQAKGAGFNAQAFITVLCRAWRIHTRLDSGGTRQVGLLDIHETLTLLPMARKEYDLTEFGRDLLLLDESGVRNATVGRTLYEINWLRASTSSKGGRVVSTVDRGGQQIGYAAIEFRSTDG